MAWRQEYRLVNKTLNRYIAREIVPTFLAGMFLAVFTVLATRLLSLTELIISRGVGLGTVSGLIGYLLPDVIHFSLPASTLIAVLMAFIRLSADMEITAMKASGLSIYQMLPSVIIFSALSMAVSGWIGIVGSPWGQRSFKDLVFELAQSKADVAIKERIFSEPFRGVVFYVQNYDPKKKVMRDVFVTDKREKGFTNTIIAKEAHIGSDPIKRMVTVRFLRGTIFSTDRSLSNSRTISFESYDMTVSLRELLAGLSAREKSPKEMAFSELLRSLSSAKDSQRNEVLVELFEKATMPLAVFLMGMVGVPLGVYIRGKGRFTGVGVGLGVFLAYYLSLVGSRNIGEAGYIHPAAVVWIPVIFLAAACIYSYLRIGSEKDLFPEFIRVLLRRPGSYKEIT